MIVGGEKRSTTDLAMEFQRLCADMAIKDHIRPGHWAVNGVILHIYSLGEIQRCMTETQMRTMIKTMRVYLRTKTQVT